MEARGRLEKVKVYSQDLRVGYTLSTQGVFRTRQGRRGHSPKGGRNPYDHRDWGKYLNSWEKELFVFQKKQVVMPAR